MKIIIKDADYHFDNINKQFIISNGIITFEDDTETDKIKLVSLEVGDEFYIGNEVFIILKKMSMV